MDNQHKLKLTKYRLGRVLLHLGCLVRGGKFAWHLNGVIRELTPRFWHRKPLIAATSISVLIFGQQLAEAGYYDEPFRPQFHFTPEKNWMNDPNGLVFYEGEYHLFYQYNPFGNKWGHMSWGHAVSPDLVHWKHLPIALAEENGIMIFSGSAVVDWNNTSGFGRGGNPPMIAIYAGNYTGKPLQNENIAYSNDRGRTWTKYTGNPVIDIGSKDFRDPKVFWYEPDKNWIMAVALSTDHKICFYSSFDLKHWQHLSDFGPAGATGGVWECPDLFPLAVDGDPKHIKWVLTVNIGSGAPAGGTGIQYFVGLFDGVQFTSDSASQPQPTPAFAPDGQVIADFEGRDYGDWKTTGDAFGPGPAQGQLPDQNPVDGYIGHGLVNSYYHGDAATGTLTSPEFKINRSFLNFLVGGGSQPETRMDLLIGGKVIRTASGEDNERLTWRSWDVRQFENQKAVLQIVDQATGGWGHISVDQIMLADAPARPANDPALWLDYGPDDYAAVSWNDIPPSDGRRLWVGWMNNWEYGQDVPTSPWRSAMSIPREVGLRQTDEGIRLVQQPVHELQSLRDKHFRFQGGNVSEANAWLAKNQIPGNQVEFMVEFAPESSGVEGVDVLKGADGETRIGINRNDGTVFVDRRHSGNVSFNPKFPGVYSAPLPVRGGAVKLHVFVDACSVEVFVNGGERVFTFLAFPPPESRAVALFAGNPRAKIDSIKAWTLNSSWK
ncbi:MAG TPA: glycoside hydrolase family 32 protein [Candidatus Angelobacter sp.]|nr:glycoside hydrolase family 32 protein [Candidatus Angelobacter sp.]